MNEFDIIEKYFAPLTMGEGAMDNDAAVIDVPDAHQLVVTTDTLNEGVHFLRGAKAADIAHKALRVNLSDLAAMGAAPLSYQLSLAFPKRPTEEWLEEFTGALLADQNAFRLYCSGGDTTSIKDALSVSVTAIGVVPKGQALTRSGAKDGDAIILTGPVGDAHIGLHILSFLSPFPTMKSESKKSDLGQGVEKYFIERYTKPQPRLDLITPVRAYATAGIDVSDGLLADLGHLAKASNLSAEIVLNDRFFSPQARAMIGTGMVTAEELLSSGDDYELLLAVPDSKADAFIKAAPGSVKIGSFKGGEPRVYVLKENGEPLDVKHTGWSHF